MVEKSKKSELAKSQEMLKSSEKKEKKNCEKCWRSQKTKKKEREIVKIGWNIFKKFETVENVKYCKLMLRNNIDKMIKNSKFVKKVGIYLKMLQLWNTAYNDYLQKWFLFIAPFQVSV